MTVNVPLLRKIVEHITEHPEEWNQRHWGTRTACGTAYCVAGHALAFTGYELEWINVDAQMPNPTESVDLLVSASKGDYTQPDIETAARRELGLSFHEAGLLFDSYNGLDEIWRLAELYSSGEIVRPDDDARTLSRA